ncbi:MAG TPA: GAF domain-containing protein, partial [Noviherbaspirillum sp.]|uniref:GAF domain-containing protein n=1 Tax=Noviherbaspirillum sp. TaxID=1926288 RepID=UPI002DDCCFA7
MSAVIGAQSDTKPNTASKDDIDLRLDFFKKLQSVTNKIHATSNVDEIMLDLSQDICDLFNCDRLTIYGVVDEKTAIASKVKTGLNSFSQLKLPISDKSVAGYVALTRKTLNIRDVYDEAELRAHSSELRFLREVDKRTGYRTKQMLVAPFIDERADELLGAVQLINSADGKPFSTVVEDALKELCKTLAIAYTQRLKPQTVIRSKYDHLVGDAVLSAAEMELATRSARRKNEDIEAV